MAVWYQNPISKSKLVRAGHQIDTEVSHHIALLTCKDIDRNVNQLAEKVVLSLPTFFGGRSFQVWSLGLALVFLHCWLLSFLVIGKYMVPMGDMDWYGPRTRDMGYKNFRDASSLLGSTRVHKWLGNLRTGSRCASTRHIE